MVSAACRAGYRAVARGVVMIESYKQHSPSSLNLFAASTAMWVLEKVLGEKQPVGVPAHRGAAVEDGVTFGLLNPKRR